jgi:hypothetical protein
MKKNLLLLIAGVLGCGVISTGYAQDVPGVAVGGFFESRVENKINNDELSFSYYGVRFKMRDEGWIEGFIDLGLQGLDLKGFESDDSGAFGLGGTFWLTRADGDVLPFDLGIYGSVHIANYTLTSDSGSETDARHTRYMVQGVARTSDDQALRPFLRAGIMGTKLDPDTDGVLPEDGLDDVKPAINAGAEYALDQNLVISIEGNYAEGVGGAVHLDYWF